MPAPAPHRFDLDMLGQSYAWEVHEPEAARLIEAFYGRFIAEEPAAQARSASRDAAHMRRPPGELPGLSLQALGDHFYDHTVEYLLLHAGAVERDGRGLILGGPSTFGKTTLTLRLVAEGYRFLGEDITPVARATGRVVPFPRGIGLRPGGDSAIAARARAAAQSGRAVAYGGKVIADIETIFPDCLGRAFDGGAVVLLDSSGENDPAAPIAVHEVELVLRDERPGLLAALRAIPGVTLEPERAAGGLPAYRVRLEASERPSAAFDAACAREKEAIVAVSPITGPTDFSRPPELARLERSRAAVSLARDLLNRRAGGALSASVEGKPGALVLELAGALASFECWTLRPGALDATVALLDDLV